MSPCSEAIVTLLDALFHQKILKMETVVTIPVDLQVKENL